MSVYVLALLTFVIGIAHIFNRKVVGSVGIESFKKIFNSTPRNRENKA